MRRAWVGTWLVAASMTVLAAACMQDFDQFFQGEETGGSGTGTGTNTGSGNNGNTGGGGSGNTGGEGGGTGGCTAPEQCPVPAVQCLDRTCEGNVCGTAPVALDVTGCDDPVAPVTNGVACDGHGNCVECTTYLEPPGTTACPTQGDQCVSGRCVPPHCSDGETNNGETDLNCGGEDCLPCVNTLACLIARDCQSGYCDGSFHCAVCTADTQCANGWCDAATAGGTCTADLANGVACARGTQCTSTFCSARGPSGSVCCTAQCEGNCESCANAQSGDPTGTCGFVDSGDPYSDCDNATCSGGVYTAAEVCHGTNSCTTETPDDCSPYGCTSSGCITDCTQQGDCDSGFYCDLGGTNDCLDEKANGQSCVNDYECEGYCSEEGATDYCCNDACDGECEACRASKTGAADGTCAPVDKGEDYDSECGANEACDGVSACKLVDGQPCPTGGGDCVSGFCSDEVADPDICCNEACTGLCHSCMASKTPENDGVCGHIDTDTDPDEECGSPPQNVCKSNQTCGAL